MDDAAVLEMVRSVPESTMAMFTPAVIVLFVKGVGLTLFVDTTEYVDTPVGSDTNVVRLLMIGFEDVPVILMPGPAVIETTSPDALTMGLDAVPVMVMFVPPVTLNTPVLLTIGFVDVPVLEMPVPAVKEMTPVLLTIGFEDVPVTLMPGPALVVMTPVLLTIGFVAVPVIEMPGPAVIAATTPVDANVSVVLAKLGVMVMPAPAMNDLML